MCDEIDLRVINATRAYLGHDHELLAREVKLFDRLSEDNLRLAVRVDLEHAHVNKTLICIV